MNVTQFVNRRVETLENKDIDGGLASNSNRISVPRGTTAELAALTRKEGAIAYNTSLGAFVVDNGSAFAAPAGAGDITAVAAGTGLTGGGLSGAVTLNVNVGTGPNQIVQLNGSSQLPAVDGSLLTNLPSSFQILSFDSDASAGGSNSEALTVTGLLATDLILSVTQRVVGANNEVTSAWNTQVNDGLTVSWQNDPGVGAIVRVAVKR